MKLLLAFFLLSLCSSSLAHRVVCYYGSWAVYRHGNAKFAVEDIDPTLCTHLIYTFAGIDDDGSVRILDPWNDVGDEWHEGAFTKLQNLKKKNKDLQISLAIGGWNEGSFKYSTVTNDPKKLAHSVKSIVDVMKRYQFDGFDLDWEYPTQRGGGSNDKKAFTAWIKALRQEFDKYGYFLSAAVSASIPIIKEAYDCHAASQYLDFINVMTYDLHGSWEKSTGHHTALFSDPSAPASEQHLSVYNAMAYWIECGVDPEKLNMGLAAYGRTYTLVNSQSFGLGALASGPGRAGKFVDEAGFMGFNELCLEMKEKLWLPFYNKIQEIPFAVKGNLWIGYDNEKSFRKKMEIASKLRLGGVMIWSIETDDFKGQCGLGKFPLLRVMNEPLSIDSPSDSPAVTSTRPPVNKPDPTPAPSEPEPEEEVPDSPIEEEPKEEVTEASTTSPSEPEKEDENEKPSVAQKCKMIGQMIRSPTDCSKFHVCLLDVTGTFRTTEMSCARGLNFDEGNRICNFAMLVRCL